MAKKTLGQYQILEKIDQGGMAEIYRARRIGPHGFQKLVAIKAILPHLSSDKDFLAMFSSEARVAAQLQHPNIVQIYDYGVEDETYYIAMEYVHGLNLNELLTVLRGGSRELGIEYAIYIAKQVCSALDYAHFLTDFRGRPLEIVHRDVNPKNIMLSFSGEIKLMDFGIALAATRCFQTLADGIIKGKLSYLSPEQVQSLELDHRSDIFSLGIVLYEMALSRRPFFSPTEFGILSKIEKANPTPPIEIKPDFPLELNHIIMKCMARNRDKRYQRAAEVRDALIEFEKTNNLEISPSNFKDYLVSVLGSEVVNTPIILEEQISTDEDIDTEFETAETIEDLDFEPVGIDSRSTDTSLTKDNQNSAYPTEKIPSAELESDELLSPVQVKTSMDQDSDSEKRDESSPTLIKEGFSPLPGVDIDVDNVWKHGSFWDRVRFPSLIILICLVAFGIAYLTVGLEGFQRLLGIEDTVVHTTFEIHAIPADADIEFDYQSLSENPSKQDIVWEFNTIHQAKITHPAHVPVILNFRVPDSMDKQITVDPLTPGVTFKPEGNGYSLNIRMMPQYIDAEIITKPSDASIMVNETPTGQRKSPLTFLFETGKESKIVASKPGYKHAETTFQPDPFAKNQSVTLTLEKDLPPTPQPKPKGKVYVNSPYEVDIYQGNSRLAKSVTRKTLLLEEGSTRLTFKNSKYLLNYSKDITVKSGSSTTINIDPLGTMILDADPPGCDVIVRNQTIGKAPGTFELAPDTYEVIFRWENCTKTESLWVKINPQLNKKFPKVTGCR
ncbi:serine/threonine protein kinase [bacterium]|nr:serine/threonine protein kinase [candidate division CSSED10-310 bacterium]